MQTKLINLSDLKSSASNVRREGSAAALNELKASIAAHGLMQNLIVVAWGKSYEVIAGSRRLHALRELQAEGKLDKGYEVPCLIVSGKDEKEISLAENIVREAMNPADEFEAFAELLKNKNNTITSVANRFGVTEKHVEQRMRLGRVSPALFKLFRADKMDLNTLMAFTITEDHKKQESVWKSLQSYQRSAHGVRSVLTKQYLSTDSREFKFVGKNAYVEAGGKIRGDLFSDNSFCENPELLKKLYDEKLKSKVEAFKKIGWSFVEIGDEYSYEFRSKFEVLDKQPAKAELKNCGLYAYVDHNGKLDYYMLRKKGKGSAAALKKADKKANKGDMSQALKTDLSAYRMQVAQVAMLMNPGIAINVLMFQLFENVGKSPWEQKRMACISVDEQTVPVHLSKEKTAAAQAFKNVLAKIEHKDLGKSPADRFAQFCKLTMDDRLTLAASAIALAMPAQLSDKNSAYDVAMAMSGVDVAAYWRPTKENYLGRITIDQLDAIGKELFQRAWQPKAMNKSYLAGLLDEAFKNPAKASNGDAQTQKRIMSWLPSGMAFATLESPVKAKSTKAA